MLVLVEFQPVVEEFHAAEKLQLELSQLQSVLLIQVLFVPLSLDLWSLEAEITQSHNPTFFLRVVVSSKWKNNPWGSDLALDLVS